MGTRDDGFACLDPKNVLPTKNSSSKICPPLPFYHKRKKSTSGRIIP
jgi:hypothetical protein